MLGIEVAKKVVEEKQAHLFRARAGAPGEYDARPYGAGSKRGWIVLDGFSAGAIVAVYNGLNETNRARFAALELVKMAKVAFKLV